MKIKEIFIKFDNMTGRKIGAVVRSITNINSRRYWNKKLASSYGKSQRDFRYQYLLGILASQSVRGDFSLLDIGCALGDGCVLLKGRFPQADISGVDFSVTGIEKAKEKASGINFFVLDITRQEPPQKYDYISMLSVLEHFNNPYSVIDRCLKYVNKSLIVISPYEAKFKDPRLYWRGEHRFLFNENTFSDYNCKVLKITESNEVTGYRYIIYELKP